MSFVNHFFRKCILIGNLFGYEEEMLKTVVTEILNLLSVKHNLFTER
jgi:hypothetical protein